MKSSSRLFIGFGIAIGILVVVTVAIVLSTRGNNVILQPENIPQGIVQRFLMAVQEKDYPKAYSYLQLVEGDRTVPYNDWVQSIPPLSSSQTAWKATLSTTIVTGTSATVEVVVDTFRPGGPFRDPVNIQTVSFQLTKIVSTWYITTRPPIYWLY